MRFKRPSQGNDLCHNCPSEGEVEKKIGGLFRVPIPCRGDRGQEVQKSDSHTCEVPEGHQSGVAHESILAQRFIRISKVLPDDTLVAIETRCLLDRVPYFVMSKLRAHNLRYSRILHRNAIDQIAGLHHAF